MNLHCLGHVDFMQHAGQNSFVKRKAKQSKESKFMKDRDTIFTTILLVLACFVLSPVAQAKQPTEDRGNGNSAAENVDALNLSTTGSNNTAHGWFSLFSNTSGSGNTADGFQALYSNTTGNSNTATGVQVLASNTSGDENTANGSGALSRNTTGSRNTANGVDALFNNTTGFQNTATGGSALLSNTTGNNNTANGFDALLHNTEGFNNTAVGFGALRNETTGIGNIALGTEAGGNLDTGNDNIYIGSFGPGSPSSESNTIRIGKGFEEQTFLHGIFGVTSAGGAGVFVNEDGKLGTTTSSCRFKDGIKPMESASEALFSFKPVTFRYKKEIDPAGTSQFGLVAEDVDKVNPDLVVHDKQGRPYSVRYDQINAMLLNEFVKEHKTLAEEHRKVEKLEATVAGLVAAVKEQAAQIQKVSAQLEVTKPAPQTVLNQ